MTAIEEMEDLNGRQVRVGACLLAEDMESMVRFYRDILGFNTQWDGENFAEFETASGELSFFMYSRKQFTRQWGELCPAGDQSDLKSPSGCVLCRCGCEV